MTMTTIRIPSDPHVDLSMTTTSSGGDTGFVFIHGILQAALCWKHQLAAPALAPWTCVAFDLRGHGYSSQPVGKEHYGDAAPWGRDIAAILDASGLRRAVLVGWSFGGRVILDYLSQQGGDPRIAGLVFVDANTRTAPGHVSDICMEMLGKTVSSDMAENIAARRAFVDLCFSTPPSEADLVEILCYNNMTAPDVLAGMLGRPMDHDDQMRRISLPTLVIHGQEDRLSLPQAGRHTASTIPGARLHLMENVGHSPQLEVRDRFNDLLVQFAYDLSL